MASEKKDTGGILKNQNVFVRICNLQSVSVALESIEKTYISTKESHPIISSVCGLYEKGVSRAGSLAVWSMKPALLVLEPQPVDIDAPLEETLSRHSMNHDSLLTCPVDSVVAANSMACKGLDRLEEKLPALQSPPEELAANIKELMSSTLETAKDGMTSPIKNTSSAVIDKVSSGYQQSKNVLNEGIQFVLNSRIVSLAEQRVDRALDVTENLVGYMLPASSAETEDDGSLGQPELDTGASGPKPIFKRLEAIADTICKRAFEKTAVPLQEQPLVTNIPGLSPLVEYTMGTMKTIGNAILGLPSSVTSLLKDGQEPSPQKEKTDSEQELPESNELPRLISRLGLKLYGSVVDNVKKTPQTGFNLAKDGVNIVLTSFGTVREKALDQLSYFGLIPSRSSKPEEVSQSAEVHEPEECLGGSPVVESIVEDLTVIHSPRDTSMKQPVKITEPKVLEISEETRQLQKVMKQIPKQQKIVLPSDTSEKQPVKIPEPKASEISEETQQQQKKVIKQLPMQQKVVLPSDTSEKQPLKVPEPKVSEMSEETQQQQKKVTKQSPMQQKVVFPSDTYEKQPVKIPEPRVSEISEETHQQHKKVMKQIPIEQKVVLSSDTSEKQPDKIPESRVSELSEETQQQQKKVMKQLPMQQKVVLPSDTSEKQLVKIPEPKVSEMTEETQQQQKKVMRQLPMQQKVVLPSDTSEKQSIKVPEPKVSEMSEETQQQQKKVMKQLPMQQKVVLPSDTSEKQSVKVPEPKVSEVSEETHQQQKKVMKQSPMQQKVFLPSDTSEKQLVKVPEPKVSEMSEETQQQQKKVTKQSSMQQKVVLPSDTSEKQLVKVPEPKVSEMSEETHPQQKKVMKQSPMQQK